MRVRVRVRPGSSRAAVGGRYDDGPEPALVVRVPAKAVDGAANAAALVALAAAFGVRAGRVTLVGGVTARTKIVAIDGDEPELSRRLAVLLEGQAQTTGDRVPRRGTPVSGRTGLRGGQASGAQ